MGHSRVVLDEKENVVQTTAYYPYGGMIAGLSTETKYNYLYTGKEFIGEFGLNWYDHHARQYDAEIGRWWAIDPSLQAVSPYMAMGNKPMMYVDADGKTWGIFKPFKKAWNYAWDKANQFARWAEENGIPSAGIGINYNNGSGFSPNANVNGQPLDLSGEIASINRGVAGVNYSFYSQMNNYRAYNRARIPLIYVEPIIFNGAWVVPYGEDLAYQTLEQAIETNARKEWYRRSSGRVEVTDSPIDYIIGAGLGKAIVSRTLRGSAKAIGNIKIPTYRVYGGQAGRFGNSWTFVNPKLYGKTYRNFAGLPNVNSGKLLLKGQVRLKDINGYRMALPLDGNVGRLTPELLINQSWNKVIWSPINVTKVNF